MPIDPKDIEISVITTDVDISDFECGDREWESEIADFLRENAFAEQSIGLNKTWVFVKEAECIAYVSLLASSLEPEKDDAIPSFDYPNAPCVMIGRLGVKTQYQGDKLGRMVLAWVIQQASDWPIGVRFLTLQVDSKNKRARGFYEKFQFQRIQGLSKGSDRFMMLDLYAPGESPTIE
ncbi:MAG: GNAT family N-acetyltransferase [Chloroflexi bacterium]|nr:GNAT family N-acetyltransferase [Chloroflexota bacterium]